MSEDRPEYRSGFRETRLADHDKREIASAFGDALLDLTGRVYAVEILTLERHPDDVTEIRLRVRRVDDSGDTGRQDRLSGQ